MKATQAVAFNLDEQRWQDMCKNTWSGIFLLPLFWLTIGYWIRMDETHPGLFVFHGAIVLGSSLMRLYWIHFLKSHNHQANIRALSQQVLFSGLHWGLLFTWLLFGIHTSVSEHYTVIVILTGLALIGSNTFNQFGYLGSIYPALIVLPASIITLIVKPEHYEFLTLQAIILLSYTYSQSNAAKATYELSLSQRKTLTQNAEAALKLSRTDYLTKLGNRFHFMENYERAWLKSVESQTPLSLIYANVNFLKEINSKHGHEVGDVVIEEIATRLNALVKAPNILARYGGDEFAIVLPETDASGAAELGNLIQSSIRDISFVHQNNIIPCSCALGLTTIKPGHDDDPAMFLEDARRSLHQANIQSNTSWTKLSALRVFDMHSSE